MLRLNKRILLTSLVISGLAFGQNWFQTQAIEKQFNQAVEHYNEGRYAITESLLKQILSEPASAYTAPAVLLSMKANLGMEHYAAAKDLGRSFLSDYPVSEYVKDIFLTFGDIFVNEGSYASAYRMFHRARKATDFPLFINKIDNRLLKLIQLSLPSGMFKEMLAVEVENAAREIHHLSLAYAHIQDGLPDEAALVLSQVSLEAVPEYFLELYEKLLRASYQPARPVTTVGLILPLSGRNSVSGKAFLAGFKQSLDRPVYMDRQIALVVQDSRSDELEAVRAARQLASLPQVSIIIGPLTNSAVLAAAGAVSKEQIPLLVPSSTQDGLGKIYDHVYQMNSTLAMRGKLAARYAILTLGLDTLAVIAPADEYGNRLTDAFLKEVDQLGKTVVATEWYSGLPKDLRKQFKSLRQVAFGLLPSEDTYDELLGMEIDSLDALFDISAEDFFDLPKEEEKRLTRLDSAKIVLSTIQGIYLPIHEEDLEYIGPQFPMYYLDTKLIGNESWQNLGVLALENIGPHVQGTSIITNRFVSQIENFNVAQYDQDKFYQGYDAAGLLLALNPAENSRRGIARALSTIDLYQGLAQFFSTNSLHPNINISLQLLEFTGRQFIHRGYFQGDSLYVIPLDTP